MTFFVERFFVQWRLIITNLLVIRSLGWFRNFVLGFHNSFLGVQDRRTKKFFLLLFDCGVKFERWSNWTCFILVFLSTILSTSNDEKWVKNYHFLQPQHQLLLQKIFKKLERSRIVQQGLILLFGSKTSQDKALVKAAAFQLIDGRWSSTWAIFNSYSKSKHILPNNFYVCHQ